MKSKQIIESMQEEQAVVAAGLAALDQCPVDYTDFGRNIVRIDRVWVRPSKSHFDFYPDRGDDLSSRNFRPYTWVGRDDDGLYRADAVYAVTSSLKSGFLNYPSTWKHGLVSGEFYSYEEACLRKQRHEENSGTRKLFFPVDASITEQIGCALHAYLPEDR